MSERLRVLFVDDEPQILEGLVRLLRPQRQVWDIRTAGSGAAALAELAARPADVVVTDMRMPGMDGAELLARVRSMLPAAVRIVLSGQSEREAVLRRVGPCHHYLAKPCSHQRLVAVIDRACLLRRELADPRLAAVDAGFIGLPSLPAAYHGLVDELHRLEPSPVRVGELIGRDIGLAASLLHMANSAAFGLERTVSDIGEAVALVGLDAVRAMMMAVHLFSSLPRPGSPLLADERLWRHSLACARLAREIARSAGGQAPLCAAAFTAGLLHDCGQLLLATRDPQGYARAWVAAADGGGPIAAAEREHLGVSHDRAGAWLLHRWDLADEVVEAVAWHHEPGRIDTSSITALVAVHIADHLLEDVPPAARGPDAAAADRFGAAGRLGEWAARARELDGGGTGRAP